MMVFSPSSNRVIPSVWGRKYVELGFTTETNKNLANYCLENNLNIYKTYSGETCTPMDFHFHCTVIYSKEGNVNSKPLPNGNYAIPGLKIPIYPTEFAVFGEEKNCLVLKLMKSIQLLNLRNYIETFGCEDSWDSYEPHITLTYNHTGILPKELPKFKIIVNSMIVQDILK